ncbi:MAG: hypothetical protein ABJP82_12270, partial [Hyphomicrobiales bacterium]
MANTKSESLDSKLSTDQLITSVRVLNCGRAEQHKEHRYGSKLPQLWWVFFGRTWVPLPLQCFVIEHRNG